MYVFSSYSLSSAGLEAVVIFSGLFLLHYEETSPDHILFGTFASNLDSVCTLKYQTPLLVISIFIQNIILPQLSLWATYMFSGLVALEID